MEILEVKCKKCGYETNLTKGTPEVDQTYSDLNEDFSNHEIFECIHCKNCLSINTASQNDITCPRCQNKLKKINKIKKCPKCKGKLEVKSK